MKPSNHQKQTDGTNHHPSIKLKMNLQHPKSNCIVIPRTLTQRVLEIAHNQHQGISKTKARLREKVWWPGLSAETEDLIKSCYAC